MEDEMFNNLSEKYPDRFVIEKYDVDLNQSLWRDVKNYSEKYNDYPVVPYVIINNKSFPGYNRNNTASIEKIISGK